MKNEAHRHTCNIRNAQVAYWAYGNPENSPVLLIHGFRGNHKGLDALARELPNYYVINPDLPGYGQSSAWKNIPRTALEYAKWIHEFCETLTLTNHIVIGHSFGATLAILYAGLYGKNIQKIILIAPVLSRRSFMGAIGALYYQFARILPRFIRRKYLINQLTDAGGNILMLKSAPFRKKVGILNDSLRNLHTLDEQIIMENFTSLYTTNPFFVVQNITAPVKIIAGTRDNLSTKVSMEKLRSALPDAITEYLPNDGHLAPLERPIVVAEAIIHFIQSSQEKDTI